jgi:ribonucleoside-diphosphate reductase alpha chain
VIKYARKFPEAWDSVTWEKSRVELLDRATGEILFELDDAEFPSGFSEHARRIIASKYFKGVKPGSSENPETSFRQVVARIVKTIRRHAVDMELMDERSSIAFENDLAYLIINQIALFNSPVLFNVGIPERNQQVSACYILGAEDNIGHIAENQAIETLVFKFGSGVGVNESALRSSREFLSSGGSASGPISFEKGKDAWAGIIKSGGKMRRAARMFILDGWHRDVIDFIRSKAVEEEKARRLHMGCGMTVDEAYGTVAFQNNNHSLRVSDAQMKAVLNGETWTTHSVDGADAEEYEAAWVWDQIKNAAWFCGDPGLQFIDTIRDWNTCQDAEEIHATNPCSEFVFLDDTSCNLASINLVKAASFGPGLLDGLPNIVNVMIMAMEVLCDYGWYPHERIDKKTRSYRPLGLGFANLGGLLMEHGIPYGSRRGRKWASEIMATITGAAYAQSARMAKSLGTFEMYPFARRSFLRVINKHRMAAKQLQDSWIDDLWDQATKLGEQYGFRNAQVTVLAPTGTIGLAMDCETTGIEPELALVKYKNLIDGGILKYTNPLVWDALLSLGYDEFTSDKIFEWVVSHDGDIFSCPDLEEEHHDVFLTSFPPPGSTKCLGWRDHVDMMGACQPFVSGAISKTINLPETATEEDVGEAYVYAWKTGLKAVAVYRDGAKMFQPMTNKSETKEEEGVTPSNVEVEPADWRKIRMEDDGFSFRHKFTIGDFTGYLNIGITEDGEIAETFIRCGGGSLQGLLDWGATMMSLALQAGCPLEKVIEKSINYDFAPQGITNHSHQDARIARSIPNYLAKHLTLLTRNEAGPKVVQNESSPEDVPLDSRAVRVEAMRLPSGPARSFCPDCGELMVPNGACQLCPNCGKQGGCG